MREFAGKTAFVTGGAAGIGLALGRAFAQSGMKVMLADIEADALQAAVKSLQEISPDKAAPSAMWPTRQASSAQPKPHSTPLGMCMWSVTMPVSLPAAVSTTSRWIIGDGSSTSI
jgi:NAD(P)-dependent dehydrogenase (short-subunit alcohol dehydrogenase family)